MKTLQLYSYMLDSVSSLCLGNVLDACGHQNVVFEELDLNSYQSIHNFADAILKKESRLDILVNNAGICGYLLQNKWYWANRYDTVMESISSIAISV